MTRARSIGMIAWPEWSMSPEDGTGSGHHLHRPLSKVVYIAIPSCAKRVAANGGIVTQT